MKPLRVSWSAIRTAEECKQKSFLQREGKRAKITNIRNFYPGTVVDHVMRVWLDDPDRPAMADLVPEVMATSEAQEKERGNIVRFRNAADRDEVRNFCTELCTRLEPILTEHVLPYPHQHGKWFKVPMNIDYRGVTREILLTGEMDLIVDSGDGHVIWDLKGTADDQYYRKVVAQLVFYDLAVWASSGRKTRAVGLIQPMCAERTLAWEVTDDARRQLLARIERFAHDVWDGETSCTTNTSTCHWCDVKHACARFAQPNLDALGELADAFRKAAEEKA